MLNFPEILRKFGFQLPSKCYCCACADSVQHCFVACPIAQGVWTFFADRFLFHYHPHLALFDLCLVCWNSKDQGPDMAYLLRYLPVIVCWSIWRVRNDCIFGATQSPPSRAIHYAISLFTSFTAFKPLRVTPRNV